MSGSLMVAQVGLNAGEVAPRKEESCMIECRREVKTWGSDNMG